MFGAAIVCQEKASCARHGGLISVAKNLPGSFPNMRSYQRVR
jgi:hypothetical protein